MGGFSAHDDRIRIIWDKEMCLCCNTVNFTHDMQSLGYVILSKTISMGTIIEICPACGAYLGA